jgi:peptidoglycan/LPS O-acetylase OafA/YrhL
LIHAFYSGVQLTSQLEIGQVLAIGEQRNITIDGVRGYLALGVLCHHFLINWLYALTAKWGEPPITFFKNAGPVGVSVFFMITAFLFYGKLVRNDGKVRWRALYTGRILRLTPMYLVSVALVLAVVGAYTNFSAAVSYSDLVAQIATWATFTLFGAPDVNGYHDTQFIIAGVTWSLRYEWLFYLCLPLMAAALRLARLSNAQRVAVLGLSLLVVEMASSYATSGFLGKLGAFLAGMVAYELHSRDWLARFATSRLANVVSGAALALALFLPLQRYGAGQILLALAAFTLIAAGNDLFGILRTRLSIKLGEASYSIYLLHGIFLHLLFAAIIHPRFDLHSLWIWSLLPVSIIAVSIVSTYTYRFVEQPFINLGRPRAKISPEGELTTREVAP